MADDEFELLGRALGEGAFAQTFKAKVLRRELVQEFGTDVVALKVPKGRQAADLLRRELITNDKLHRELKGAPGAANVVHYLGFSSFRDQIVMAMEFVSDGDLCGRIEAKGKLEAREAARIAEGVLRGIAAIHSQKIFHRDIKPANILMSGNTPKVADLGIARALQHTQERAYSFTGTLLYMPPETFSKKGSNFSADIWAVGVMLYEMLAGRTPWVLADNPWAVVHEIIHDAPPPLGSFADVPPALEEVVLRALRKDPAERFRKADEMQQALTQFLEGSRVKVEPQPEAAKRAADDAPETRLREAVVKNPKQWQAWLALGEFLNRCHRFDDAAKAFEQGNQVDAARSELHWALAMSFQGLGRREEAAREIREALRLGVDPALERRANLLLRVLK